jgi:DNA-binding CsgD family transcriptional regulator
MTADGPDDAGAWISLVAEIIDARDGDRAREAFDRVVAPLGIDVVGYGSALVEEDRTELGVGGGDRWFLDICTAMFAEGLEGNDPTIDRIAAGATWATATPQFRRPRASARHRRMPDLVRLLEAHDVRNYVVLRQTLDGPRHRFVTLSTSTAHAAEALDDAMLRHATRVQLATAALMSRLDGPAQGPRGTILTRSEASVLARLAAGQTPEEIASDTGRSIRTIRHQITAARNRLDMPTTVAAVMLARDLGEITAPLPRIFGWK